VVATQLDTVPNQLFSVGAPVLRRPCRRHQSQNRGQGRQET
jgi:hypothetical protein